MLFLVIGFQRPRYLDVTLESIYRIRGIQRHSVVVSIDGGGERRGEVLKALRKYPLDGYIIRKRNLGNLKHMTFSIANMMQWGYDEVVCLEEDLIVRPDVLEYLETAPRDAFFISLSKQDAIQKTALRRNYLPLGNLVRSDCFPQLVDYVRSGAYVGTWAGTTVPPQDVFTSDCSGHHPIYFAFARDYKKLSRVPPMQYVQHFGVVGLNFYTKRGGGELENQMFSGSRKGWLNTILKLAQSSDCPAFRGVGSNKKRGLCRFSYGEEL